MFQILSLVIKVKKSHRTFFAFLIVPIIVAVVTAFLTLLVRLILNFAV